MGANLNTLPVELIEWILTLVDLETIKSVRAVCRYLAANGSGPCFQSFLAAQKISLDWPSVRKLSSIASHPALRSAVTTLGITATVYDTSEVDLAIQKYESNEKEFTIRQRGCTKFEVISERERNDLRQNRDWLVSRKDSAQEHRVSEMIFHLGHSLRKLPRLTAIKIDCAVARGKNTVVKAQDHSNWPEIFTAASQVFQLTIAAIIKSKLTLESLDAYFDTERCSIPVTNMTSILEKLNPNWSTSQLPLKSFSISISTFLEAYGNEEPNGYRSGIIEPNETKYEISEASFESLVNLLGLLSPALEDLKIHLYKTFKEGSKGYEQLFSLVAYALYYPKLRSCTLQGIWATEEALLEWLSNHSHLEYLELAGIRLKSGAWASIFKHISKMPKLQKLKCSCLIGSLGGEISLKLEEDHLADDDRRAYPCTNGMLMHTRDFERYEFENGINWESRGTGRPYGSPWLHACRTDRQRRYGPPK